MRLRGAISSVCSMSVLETQSLAKQLSVHHSPKFLNHIAWTQRWRDRDLSQKQAAAVCEITTDDRAARRQHGLALRTLAWQAKWRGEMEDARILCERAIEPLAATGTWGGLADVYSVLAIVHLSQFRLAASDHATSRAFALVNGNAPLDSQVDLLTTRASLLSHQGRIEEAGDCLVQAQGIAKGIEQARLCQNLSRYQLDTRRPARGSAAGRQRHCSGTRLQQPRGAAVFARTFGQRSDASGAGRTGPWCAGRRLAMLALEDQDKRVECHLLSLLGTARLR